MKEEHTINCKEELVVEGLPVSCKHLVQIENHVKIRIINKFTILKLTLNKEEFNHSVTNEIADLKKSLSKLLNDISKDYESNTKYACNWNYCYHLTVGCIRALENLLDDVPKPMEKGVHTRDTIIGEFQICGKIDWDFAFKHKYDFDLLVNILEKHFTNQDYKLPEIIIELKPRTKTRLAEIFKNIYRNLGGKPLSTDVDFMNIVRCLNHFKDDPNLYKTLTK